ncbi:MAG: DUF4386 domain-containing protein [Myxococcota bacterium]
MDETKRLARVAGYWYLALFFIAPISLLYVPGKIVVAGDAVATAENLRRHDGLLRLGIGTELLHQALVIFLVLALYKLFRPVDEFLAKQLVVLGALVSVPIMFVNVLNDVAASILASRPDFLAGFDGAQLDALAYLFVKLHGRGIVVASVFWGLWLFPFGRLVIRSRFIPPILGWLLMVAGGAYLAAAFVTLVAPALAPYVSPVTMPLEIAEVPIIFWLAIWGARTPRDQPVASPA